jgi:hypothetical protein
VDPVAYTLSIDIAGRGRVTVEPEASSYEAGTLLTLRAKPGSHFVSWSGDLTGTDSTVTIAIEADTAITATFSR